MPDFVPLQALVHAIVSAVTGAQQEVEKTQIANLISFLDQEHRPLTLQLRLPSLRPEAEPGEEDYYQAPLLALIPHTTLRIKQVEFSFDIELGDLAAPASAPAAPGNAISPEAASVLAATLERSINVNPAVSGAEAARDDGACRPDDRGGRSFGGRRSTSYGYDQDTGDYGSCRRSVRDLAQPTPYLWLPAQVCRTRRD
jgi:hypothetical protein